MRLPLAALVLPLTLLAACLENEEEIEVRADGSLRVVATVRGGAADVAGGYNLPLAPPWAPADAGARAWLRHLGADTGSPEVVARAADADWRAWFGIDPQEDELELSVAAELRSVADWPRFTAPASEPYRTAFLERSASLSVEDKGDRLVYTFERTYHGRPYAGYDVKDRLEEALPEPIRARIDALEPLAAGELDVVAAVARAQHAELFANLARDAVEVAYTRGSAAVPPAAADRARAAVEAVAGELFDPASVDDLWTRIRAWAAASEAGPEPEGPNPMEELDLRMRARMRAALAGSLAADRVPEEAANELRFGLEWAFARYDHTLDLSDESFRVTVRMPGAIVAGSYDELEDGAARWELDAEDLRDRDVVLRAVSVLAK